MRQLFVASLFALLCLWAAVARAAEPDVEWLNKADSIQISQKSQKDARAQVVGMLGELDKTVKKGKPPRSEYVFDPETLHEIAKKGVGLPYEQMFDVIQNELVKRYPDHVVPTRRWIFNVAGGAMGQLTVLYCSTKEYLIFFGTPIGTEGFSGRFKNADVWDFTFDGEMLTYTEGEYRPHVFGPGSAALLARGTGKGYKIPDHAFMLEYMRGNVLGAMKFGIYSSTANVTLDWNSAWNQVHDCGKIALHEIFGRKGRRGD